MALKYKLWSLFLILSLIKVGNGQLMCYVCENCADITNVKVPLVTCDEDFFNTAAPGEPSTQTTSDLPTSTASSSTAMPDTTMEVVTSTSTIVSTTDSTTEASTEQPETTEVTTDTSTQTTEETTTETGADSTTPVATTNDPITDTTMNSSTESSSTGESSTSEPTTTTPAQPPTPPTAYPGTTIPTPPNPGSVQPIDDTVADVELKERSTPKNYVTSSEFRVRQLRSVPDYTYHCYKVLTSVNGTMVTNRGCSRVKTVESVCGKYKEQNPTEQLSRCYPCSSTRCNGSTALNVSVVALLLAIVAALLQHK